MAEAAENLIPALSRRSVVRGAAWTTPVIAVATTAPAFASSAIPCPVVAPGSQWSTRLVSGTPSSKPEDWTWNTTSNRWVVFQDNASSSTATLVYETTSPAFSVIPGSSVAGSFAYYWGYGNGDPAQSAQGTFQVFLNGTTLLTTLVRPGTPAVYTSRSLSFVAPAGSTTATLTYRYAMEPPAGKPASDDIVVGAPVFGACTVN